MPTEETGRALGDVLRSHPMWGEIMANRGQADDEVADDPGPTCATCKDAGWLSPGVPFGHPQFGTLVECPCGIVAERKRQKIWSASQIPPKMLDYSLGTYVTLTGNIALVEDLREWQRRGSWALLTGAVGLGKTGLAISLLLESMKSGRSGLYVVTPDFLLTIRSTYRDGSGEIDELDVLASVKAVDVLVLDDLGKVQLSKWGQEKLFTLVNERWLHDRLTIVTTNLDVDDGSLEAHLDAATWDRLRTQCQVFKLEGKSLRRRLS